VHLRAETLRAEKIGALSDSNPSLQQLVNIIKSRLQKHQIFRILLWKNTENKEEKKMGIDLPQRAVFKQSWKFTSLVDRETGVEKSHSAKQPAMRMQSPS